MRSAARTCRCGEVIRGRAAAWWSCCEGRVPAMCRVWRRRVCSLQLRGCVCCVGISRLIQSGCDADAVDEDSNSISNCMFRRVDSVAGTDEWMWRGRSRDLDERCCKTHSTYLHTPAQECSQIDITSGSITHSPAATFAKPLFSS